jgi:hypothetical protein
MRDCRLQSDLVCSNRIFRLFTCGTIQNITDKCLIIAKTSPELLEPPHYDVPVDKNLSSPGTCKSGGHPDMAILAPKSLPTQV